MQAGYKVILVMLDAPPNVLDARRAGRGSNQNPVWLKGATTRAARLGQVMTMDARVIHIDTLPEPKRVAAALQAVIPALGVLHA